MDVVKVKQNTSSNAIMADISSIMKNLEKFEAEQKRKKELQEKENQDLAIRNQEVINQEKEIRKKIQDILDRRMNRKSDVLIEHKRIEQEVDFKNNNQIEQIKKMDI